MRVWKQAEKILPRYAWIPVIASVILNILVYFGSRVFTTNLYHYDFSIFLDDMIPFVPAAMFIYVAAYIVWMVGFVVIGRESRQVCYEVMSAEQIAKLMCLACFVLIPSTITRPEITGTGFADWLSGFIYSTDAPDNLFPSIHCLESWLCFRGAMRCRKTGKAYKAGMFAAALLVFASTLLVKQHVFVDVLGGIAVTEAGLFLAKKCRTARMYASLERKMVGNERF